MGRKKKSKIFVGLDGIDVNIKTEKVYKESHKKSYELLHEGLESALNHLPEDAVIFMLMHEMNVLHELKQ